MNSVRRKSEVWNISRRPKNILRLWPAPSRHKPQDFVTQKGYFKGLHENNTKESLLAGELSDGRQHRQNPIEVPKGSVGVYVGTELRRFVIPASYLSMPDFRVLMEKAAEEFGFEQEGGLRIPCEEDDFEKILARCTATHSKTKKK